MLILFVPKSAVWPNSTLPIHVKQSTAYKAQPHTPTLCLLPSCHSVTTVPRSAGVYLGWHVKRQPSPTLQGRAWLSLCMPSHDSYPGKYSASEYHDVDIFNIEFRNFQSADGVLRALYWVLRAWYWVLRAIMGTGDILGFWEGISGSGGSTEFRGLLWVLGKWLALASDALTGIRETVPRPLWSPSVSVIINWVS